MKCLCEQSHVKRLVLDRKNIYHYVKDAIFLKILFKLHPTTAHKKAQKPREAEPSFRALLNKLDRIIQSN